MNKKGQLKIQQMIFMLIGIALFFSLIGLFAVGALMGSLNEKARLAAEENAVLLTLKIADSPEFSCAKTGDNLGSCIDFDKVIHLKENSQKYEKFWGVRGIEIKRIYPSGNDIECTKENYPECDSVTVFPSSSGTGVAGFVSLCRVEDLTQKKELKCDLAQIIVIY